MDGGKEKQAKQVGEVKRQVRPGYQVNRVEQLIWLRPQEALPEDQQSVLFMGPRGLAMGVFVAEYVPLANKPAVSVFVDEVRAPFLPEHVTWWAAVPVGPR